MSSSIWICFYHNTITCCQVVPPPPPDDLLHAVLVSRRDAEPEDEDEDELQIVAEIHHQTEPAVREPPSQGRFHRSDPQTWHWEYNRDSNEGSPRFHNHGEGPY